MESDDCQNKFQHTSKEEKKLIKLPTSCSFMQLRDWIVKGFTQL